MPFLLPWTNLPTRWHDAFSDNQPDIIANAEGPQLDADMRSDVAA